MFKIIAVAIALSFPAADALAQQSGSAPASRETARQSEALENLVDTAELYEDLSTFINALQATGLVEDLAGGGPFTVFAPNGTAFAKLPATRENEIMDPENRDELRAILEHHIIAGQVILSSDVTDRLTPKTLDGSELAIRKPGSTLLAGRGRVIEPNIRATNGVIHIVETLLVPPAI